MDMPDDDYPSLATTMYHFNHIVLPRQLPQINDYKVEHDNSLLETAKLTLQDMKHVVNGNQAPVVESAITSIDNLIRSRDKDGAICETGLKDTLVNITNGKSTGVLPIHVKAQNAGLIIRRDAEHVVFESFELSPTNEAVMETKGRLIRQFPGQVARIKISQMKEDGLLMALASTLAKMSDQAAPGCQSQTRKAGHWHPEKRNTTHPMMVTDLLIRIISSIGEPTNARHICKATREEVFWNRGELPWRRSALWLLLRVTLHSYFDRECQHLQHPNILYKVFVILLLSRVLLMEKHHYERLGPHASRTTIAKLHRRFCKIGKTGHDSALPANWTESVHQRILESHKQMQDEWKVLATTTLPRLDSNTFKLSALQDSLNTDLILLNSFLSEVMSRKNKVAKGDFKPTLAYYSFSDTEIPQKVSGHGETRDFSLIAVETWIEKKMPSWIKVHKSKYTTCEKLGNLIKEYHSAASAAYKDLPHGISVMYLNLLELWIACDTSACLLYPLLNDYDPEVELDVLQCLLLPQKKDMTRLHNVEIYIQARREAAHKENPSVFGGFGNPQSFANCYFSQCRILQTLKSEIERDAATKRHRKCEELKELKLEYRKLMAQYDSGECEIEVTMTDTETEEQESNHSPTCSRCKKKKEANELKIQIYEWPLSSDLFVANATVFELKSPEVFNIWRDTLMYVITNILQFSDEKPTRPNPRYDLEEHQDLSHMLSSRHKARRILPVSEARPQYGTHYKHKDSILNVHEENVCVASGLKYRYFDDLQRIWTKGVVANEKLPKLCFMRMPRGSRSLERFMYRPVSSANGVPCNETITIGTEYPQSFTSEESRSFGTISLGCKIIYHNLAVQLAMPVLDFSKIETQSLLLQAMHQAGPPNSSVQRLAHQILTQHTFSEKILYQLNIALEPFVRKWDSWSALASFSHIARRILSLSDSVNVIQSSLRFLTKIQEICMNWLDELKSRTVSTSNDDERSLLYLRAAEIALLCISTFDVEEIYYERIFQNPSAVSTLLTCSIRVNESMNIIEKENNFLYNSNLRSWRALMYRAFPTLVENIFSANEGLNDAIVSTWDIFQPEAHERWSNLSKPYENWLELQFGTMKVDFNLLTSELLVNGAPLASLPTEFTKHNSYSLLFGKRSMEVGPSDEPGMRFSARAKHHSYNVHLEISGSDLLLVALRKNSRLDLIPSRLFNSVLPHDFIHSFVHWYSHKTEEILFRPRNDPWPSLNDENQWYLKRSGSSWHLIKGHITIMNIASLCARTLSSLLKSLDETRHMHLSFNTISHSLDIKLPRLELDFMLDNQKNRIYSRQFRGMFIDEDQDPGTLTGLSSKLVLRSENLGTSRLILVPEGNFHYVKTSNHHIAVSVDRERTKFRVHAYTIDLDLKRIIDTGDIQSKLVLCYLHALTSYYLPDHLTGLTGMESALKILKSAAVWSFETLSEENLRILYALAKITPIRRFYPHYEKVMQQVTWDKNLPVPSQHVAFLKGVLEVFRLAEQSRFLHPSSENPKIQLDTVVTEATNLYLSERDAIRGSTFYVDEFGAESFSKTEDGIYKSRDRFPQSDKGLKAFLVTKLIVQDEVTLCASVSDLKNYFCSQLLRSSVIKGLNAKTGTLSLRYDARWLQGFPQIIEEHWCEFHQILTKNPMDYTKYDILMWLSTMAYAGNANMDLVQTLAMLYRCRNSTKIKIPPFFEVDLSEGKEWKHEVIHRILRLAANPLTHCPEFKIRKCKSESRDEWRQRISRVHEKHQKAAMKELVASLEEQFPCEKPNIPASSQIQTYFNMRTVSSNIATQFQEWHDNGKFLAYLQELSDFIARQPIMTVKQPCWKPPPTLCQTGQCNNPRFLNSDAIFAASPLRLSDDASDKSPAIEGQIAIIEQSSDSEKTEKQDQMKHLCQMLSCMIARWGSAFEKEYVKDLRTSCRALKEYNNNNITHAAQINEQIILLLETNLKNCARDFERINRVLEKVVEGIDGIALHVQLSPRISPSFWLSQLGIHRFNLLSQEWKDFIVSYGLKVTQLHRAQRLLALSEKPLELAEELLHIGHINWDPQSFPETLLLEAESGIMLREVQEVIAAQMRSPNGGTNSILQLNMGEGKSSTIIPVVAAALADGRRLVRVIVAKPQSQQMTRMLTSKLGGLLNRRIYHIPISRDLKFKIQEAKALQTLYENCLADGGILLMQPEHILSQKLMAIECLLAGRSKVARSLLTTEAFLDKHARDLVDESDENFSVKFELVYTIGNQRAIDFAPMRWCQIQKLFDFLVSHTKKLRQAFPSSIEVIENDGRVPRVRILRKDAATELCNLLANDVIDQILTGLSSPNERTALFRYITQSDVRIEDKKSVEEGPLWKTEETQHSILLFRGMIAHGILAHVLGAKRYRVDYGFHSARIPATKLAVPFRFKDGPSLRAEFSHPDVVISLTLLSYYYEGLSDEDLFQSFHHLFRNDQSSIRYKEWVWTAHSNLPHAFRNLSGIPIKDRPLCVDKIFPNLRYSKACIDYFTSHIVFPKQVKEFEKKLTASGWDLGKVKSHPLTGFSGTCDTQHVLPLNIQHLNLPSQAHTNALVIANLLGAGTTVDHLLPHRSASDAENLLNLVVKLKPDIRVILDCGAVILEQTNRQVAEAWLKMTDQGQIQAAVFFDEEDLSVIDRTGRVELLYTSPFARQLDVCVVYLDESHTRGTDLKLPRTYRAALTLGAGLTKDRLVQAAMRMRKLGKGQSVAIIVPEEIVTKIRERVSDEDEVVEVKDVICWCISETWLDLKKSIPLWASQGYRFELNQLFSNGIRTTKEQARLLLEQEAQNLESRYRPQIKDDDPVSQFKHWDHKNENLNKIIDKHKKFNTMGFSAADMEEEQERELAPEKEEERLIESRPKMDPANHVIHEDLRHLVRTGEVRTITSSTAFEPAFRSLKCTTAAKAGDLTEFPCDLLVTSDFTHTIKEESTANQTPLDSYQRVVQWIISVFDDGNPAQVKNLVIISPHEANLLIDEIQTHRKVTLHIYSPCISSSHAPLDQLTLWSAGRLFTPDLVPRSLTIQLNLFAGSLYLRSYAEYCEFCDTLGLIRSPPQQGQEICADGFITSSKGLWGLENSPVPVLRVLLMRIRREGEGLEMTHIGKILKGKILKEGDFHQSS